MRKRIFPMLLMLVLCLMAEGFAARAEFLLPASVLIVEDGAFEETAISGSVYIPAETQYVSPSAFDKSVTKVYGYLGTGADAYAREADKTFVPLDILNLDVSASALWIPEGESVTLTASADSESVCQFAFSVDVGGAHYESPYSYSEKCVFTLDTAGEATVTVKAKSARDEVETVKTAFIHVEPAISFSAPTIYIEPGDTASLLSENEEREVNFFCNSPLVYVENGCVTGLTVGSCTISAEAVLPGGTVKQTLPVTVCSPVSAMTLSGLPKGMYVGESAKAALTYAPSNAHFHDFIWYSSDESVLTVDETGTVTGVGAGTATVTVQAHSGKTVSFTMEIWNNVNEIVPPVDFITDTEVLTPIPCTVLPENAHDKTLTFTSSDPNTAVIVGDKIKGLKPGEVIVTAAAKNGVSVSFPVTINHPVTSVKMAASSYKTDLYGYTEIGISIYPVDASDRKLYWSSSDGTVAEVDENGMVYGVGAGTAVITAESTNGKTASCSVTVYETLPTNVDFEKLNLTMNPGEQLSAALLFTPDKAQNKLLTYTSSDPSVVSVDENGLLTALAPGSATITAVSTANPTVRNTCKVFVVKNDDLPLAGIVIGINPGHQITPLRTEFPMAPGSSTMKGAVGVGGVGSFTGVPEYETNLQVSLKLRDMLTEMGAEVVMTRTENDVMIHNISRAEMLNNANVDMAIQVHCNDGGSPSTSGVSTYYRTGSNWVDESRDFAEAVGEHICSVTGANNRGVILCNTYMSLNYSTTPAILVEMGYMSSKTEDYLLADDDYRTLLARGMLEAIADYFGREL